MKKTKREINTKEQKGNRENKTRFLIGWTQLCFLRRNTKPSWTTSIVLGRILLLLLRSSCRLVVRSWDPMLRWSPWYRSAPFWSRTIFWQECLWLAKSQSSDPRGVCSFATHVQCFAGLDHRHRDRKNWTEQGAVELYRWSSFHRLISMMMPWLHPVWLSPSLAWACYSLAKLWLFKRV